MQRISRTWSMDFPELIDLLVPKRKEDEAATNFMKKLEMIIDVGETIWFYLDSPTKLEMMEKGCDVLYDSSEVQRFLNWVLW